MDAACSAWAARGGDTIGHACIPRVLNMWLFRSTLCPGPGAHAGEHRPQPVPWRPPCRAGARGAAVPIPPRKRRRRSAGQDHAGTVMLHKRIRSDCATIQYTDSGQMHCGFPEPAHCGMSGLERVMPAALFLGSSPGRRRGSFRPRCVRAGPG